MLDCVDMWLAILEDYWPSTEESIVSRCDWTTPLPKLVL